MKIERLTHPLDSPDLSPCDFWFFGWAKTALQNQRFADADAVIEALTDLFDSLTFEELQSVFENCSERLEWIIRQNGKYFIKCLIKLLLVPPGSRNRRALPFCIPSLKT
jgi:hypothetical protein